MTRREKSVYSWIDRVVAAYYWPALSVAICVIVIAPLQAATHLIVPTIVSTATWMVGGLCVPLFVLMLADKETREAIDLFNRYYKVRWKSLTWRQRLFLKVGDRNLRICFYLLWCEGAIVMFVAPQLSQLVFFGFFLVCLMRLLTLKWDQSLQETGQMASHNTSNSP